MRRWVVGTVLALALAAGCGGATWVFPTAAPLPEGAVAVPIRVQAIPVVSSDTDAFGCPAALLQPVEMVVDRSVAPPEVSFRSVESGEPVEIEWSWGISAYELDDTVHVVAADGQDLMVEDVVADDIGGGFGAEGDVFGACDGRSLPRRL